VHASLRWVKRHADMLSTGIGVRLVETGESDLAKNIQTKCSILYYSENNNGNPVQLFGYSSDEEVTRIWRSGTGRH